MKDMLFTIEINAGREKVWDTLWQDESFRDWAGIIDPGTYMTGELKEGNEIQFISAENGYGVTSRVEKLIPGAFLQLNHIADTQDTGKSGRDDEWTGGEETYTLEENDGVTTLTFTCGVPVEMEDYFKTTYPKALKRVKVLAES